jgi:hypothetical protein
MIYCKRVVAVVAHRLSYFEEAENIFGEVLSTLEQGQEPNIEAILFTRSDLAALLVAALRFPKAENLLKSAEQLRSSIADPDQPETMRVIQVSLLLYYYRGYYSKTEIGSLSVLKEDCRLWSSQEILEPTRFWSLYAKPMPNPLDQTTPRLFSRRYGSVGISHIWNPRVLL